MPAPERIARISHKPGTDASMGRPCDGRDSEATEISAAAGGPLAKVGGGIRRPLKYCLLAAFQVYVIATRPWVMPGAGRVLVPIRN